MRYELYNAECRLIGEAETAQGIADIAEHGMWSHDTKPDQGYPNTVWQRCDGIGLTGTSYRYRFEAINACAALKVQK